MPSPVEYLPVLASLTTLSPAQWNDFIASPPAIQMQTVQNYKTMHWVQDPDRFGQVLAVLETAASVAGAVAGIAGAIQALKTLAS